MAADTVLFDRVGKLDVVWLFAGDIVPDPNAPLGWRSGNEEEEDKTGLVFSNLRVLAAAALCRMNPALKLLVSGGNTNVPGMTSPPIAQVVALELMQLGVPASVIIEEHRAFSAQEQIVFCATLSRPFMYMPSRIAILAPFWQAGRIFAMVAHMNELAISPFRLSVSHFISMERALAAEDAAKWNAYFVEKYGTPAAKEMFAKEALGTGQLWAGRQPKYEKPYADFPDPLA